MARKYVLKRTAQIEERKTIIDESRFQINYREQLNAAQYEAVSAVDGAYLIIAGAGKRKNKNFSFPRCSINGIRLRSFIDLTSNFYT